MLLTFPLMAAIQEISARVGRVADRHRRPPRDLDLLQLAVREERDEERRDRPHQRVDLAGLAGGAHDHHVADHAEADAERARDQAEAENAEGLGEGAAQDVDLLVERELLEAFDHAYATGHAALRSTNDEHLRTTWKLLAGGQVMQEQPRYIAIGDSVLNHWAHHRGQLTVYLRLNDIAIPSVYGPTADEKFGQ